MQSLVEREPGPLSAWARYHWAQTLHADGDSVEARRVAIAGRDAFPESRGGNRCHNLVAQIEAKSISVTTESVWNAPWPELAVTYRNITGAHFRLVPADWNKLREKQFRRVATGGSAGIAQARAGQVVAARPAADRRLQATHGAFHRAQRREAGILFSHLQRGGHVFREGQPHELLNRLDQRSGAGDPLAGEPARGFRRGGQLRRADRRRPSERLAAG